MNTSPVIATKKKLIDIKDDTFKVLSVMAVQKGTNLKNLIEELLEKIANEYNDEKLYKYLLDNDSEGKQILSDVEQSDFEKWLGI